MHTTNRPMTVTVFHSSKIRVSFSEDIDSKFDSAVFYYTGG